MSEKYQIHCNVFISFRYADQVSVGDEVLLQVNDELTPVKVTHVSNIILQGNYLKTTAHRL